jgi:CheY-like chemotaxis protein
VELHGGEVRADSHGEGQGATFTVKLPIIPVYQRQETEERVHPRTAAILPQIEAADRIDGIKVLVVDDEPDTRELLKTMLASCGAEVTMAPSAKLALAEMERSRFDVIVSDIGMPEVDGYELMQRIRCLPVERGGKTPAVALTAYARAEDRLRALRAGYKMHVSKPIERAELIVVVASVVGRTHSA